MNSINLKFEHPFLLLLLIPAIVLACIPFFRLPKHRRHSNGRILSLILHSIILTLTTFVLAGFRIQLENVIKTKDIIFLVDQSYSLETKERKVDSYLANVFNNYDSDYRLGIVNFAKDYEYVAKLSKNAHEVLKTYLDTDSKVDTSGTDFANALYYAKSLFKNPKNGRIIIVSDGLQTDEDGLAACKNLVGDGVIVDCIYMENDKWTNDVVIESVNFVETPTLNSSNKLQINLQNFGLREAKITITDNRTVIYDQKVSLIQEKELVEIPVVFTSAQLHEIKIVISADNDQIEENNVYYTYANIEGAEKILLVEGKSGLGQDLETMLTSFSYECVKATTENVQTFNLDDYGQVILINVDNKDLPAGYDEKLDEFVKTGGNLFTTGGKNTYNLGHMKGTKFDDFMPINFEAADYKPQVFMFLIDNSSSMKETISGSSKTKMELAKEATITAIESLNSYDYVGVITFAKEAKLVCEILPVSRKSEIIDKIETIEPIIGTNYLPAFELANTNLTAFTQIDSKNIIFISDGNPQDSQYKAYLASMYAKKITTSTIALGSNINESEMKELAELGGGNYYRVNKAAELVEIMLEATESFAKDEFVEGTNVPIITRHGSIMSGIRTLPELKGYNRISAKANSSTYLAIDDNPIYTTWDYYEGKVGCFMGDLSKEYAPLYFENEQGLIFIRNIVNSMSTTTGTHREMSVTINDDNYSKVVQIRSSSSGGNNEISGKLTLPDKSTRNIRFTLTSNNTYSAILGDCNQPGIYSLEITKNSSGKRTTQIEYFTFSYSKEYVFDNHGIDFLNEMSKVSKHGELFNLEDELFTNEIEYDVLDYNPQILFLTIALVLFLFDILVRKFKLKINFKKSAEKKKQVIQN